MSDPCLPGWKPQMSVGIVFSDETAQTRSDEEFKGMFGSMRETANKYGFDLSYWGTEKSLMKFFETVRRSS